MELKELTPYELENLIEEAETLLKNKYRSTATHHEVIEKDIVIDTCPHCGSKHVIKYGHHNGVQRYQCKDCKATFGSTNDSLLYRSRFSYDIWINFIQCELLHLSLRKTADLLSISVTSCFYLRHKLYDAISKLEETKKLSGDTQVDAMFLSINLKGTRPKQNAKN